MDTLYPNLFETITHELWMFELMEAYGYGLYMRRKTTGNWDDDHYLYASVRSRRRRIVLEEKRGFSQPRSLRRRAEIDGRTCALWQRP